MAGDRELQLCPWEAQGCTKAGEQTGEGAHIGRKGNNLIFTGASYRAGLSQAHCTYAPCHLPINPVKGKESHPHFTGEDTKPMEVTLLAQGQRVLRP